jgi:hypothetical protein
MPPRRGSLSFMRAAGTLRKESFVVTLLLLYVGSVTLFGKGPTYIGIPPVFWGEIVLVLSLVWAFQRWNRVLLSDSGARALTGLVCCFLLLGAAEFINPASNFSFDALRDSAACYYSLFFFVGLVLASDRSRLVTFASRWKLFFVLAIPWEALNAVTGRRAGDISPMTPYGVPILGGGGSELLQSAGLGCLLLLMEGGSGRFRAPIPRTLLIAIGLLVLAFTTGRGARLAVAAAFLIATLAYLRQPGTGSGTRRRLLLVALLAMVAIIGAIAASVDVVQETNLSRFGDIFGEDTGGTATWRADWWRGIEDAVMERNPLWGLGFGDPLWEYNPWVDANFEGRFARAPHNYNMDIFGRMGFVGAFCWGGILVLGFFRPLWKVISATTVSEQAEARQQVFWIAALAAIWVNSSFGVLMEGPVDGIPFWLVLGIVARGAKVNLRRVRVLTADDSNAAPRLREPMLRPEPVGIPLDTAGVSPRVP